MDTQGKLPLGEEGASVAESPKDLVTTREAVRLSGWNRSTIGRWRREGKLTTPNGWVLLSELPQKKRKQGIERDVSDSRPVHVGQDGLSDSTPLAESPNDLVKTAEAARVCDVSQTTIDRWKREGHLSSKWKGLVSLTELREEIRRRGMRRDVGDRRTRDVPKNRVERQELPKSSVLDEGTLTEDNRRLLSSEGVSRQEAAKQAGVIVRTIDKWAAAGLIERIAPGVIDKASLARHIEARQQPTTRSQAFRQAPDTSEVASHGFSDDLDDAPQKVTLTTRQAAERLGKSTQTVRNWVTAGKILRAPDGNIDAESLERFLEQGETAHAAKPSLPSATPLAESPNDLKRIEDAKRLWGLHPKTIWKWIKKGRVPRAKPGWVSDAAVRLEMQRRGLSYRRVFPEPDKPGDGGEELPETRELPGPDAFGPESEAESPMSTDLVARRRTVLCHWLHDNHIDKRQAAAQAGYDPIYFQALLSGHSPISDSTAWRLRFRLGVPLDDIEPTPLSLASQRQPGAASKSEWELLRDLELLGDLKGSVSALHQINEMLERELADAKAEKAELFSILRASQSSPRPHKSAEKPESEFKEPPVWERILHYILTADRPRRTWQVQRDLNLKVSPTRELSRLTSRKLIQRIAPGLFWAPGREYNVEGDC